MTREVVLRLMGVDVVYRQSGETATSMRVWLQGMKQRALNLAPVFQRFRDVWFEQNEQVFAQEGMPGAWPRLSPAYTEWKSRNFPGKSILRRTDVLFGSLTSQSGDTIYDVSATQIRLGTRVPWGALHQSGTSTMPARPAVVLLPETFAELNAMVVEHIMPVGDGR